MKKQNRSKKETFLVDRISNLPDSILGYILSFLPTTKPVVATSILSKRWLYVWTSVDKLNFDNYEYSVRFNGQIHFAPFVYRVLELHQGNISDLQLHCFGRGCNELDITNWINIAIARGVEKLVVFTDFSYNCPLSIFFCETLVDLEIRKLDFSDMNIPSSPFFPCLKKLHVQHLKFDTESLKHFISRCPSLEDFLVYSRGVDVIPVDIVSSKLKRIDLHSFHGGFDEKFHFGLPALEYLRFRSVLPPELLVEEKLGSLVEADVRFIDDHYTKNVDANQLRDSFVKFIQPFANVKVLRLNCHFIKFLTSAGDAQFHNLTKLEIQSLYFEWRLLVCLMESSINLESITLKKTSQFKKHKLAWIEPKNVPACLSSSLRKISIDGYSRDDLPMVKYVLRNAEILVRIDIRCADCYIGMNKRKSAMLQKIQKLQRASEGCKISLA